jgi:YtfJ family uncharacterized protein
MRFTCLPSIILAASLALLLQSAAFANERRNTGVMELEMDGDASKFSQHHPESEGKNSYTGAGGKADGSLKQGQALPVLDIEAGGEISVSEDKIVQKPWSSKSFESKGKVHVVQYVAASRSAVRQNKPFTDALLEKQISSEKLDATIIVNMADTMAFAKGYVANKLAKNKIKRQAVNFVIDDNGVGLQRWGMKHESFAIIVLDASGKVLFAKDGPLSENEIEYAIKLIENQII